MPSVSPPVRMAIGLIAAGAIGPAIVVWAFGGGFAVLVTAMGSPVDPIACGARALTLLIAPPILGYACSRLLWWGAEGPIAPRQILPGIILGAVAGPVVVGVASAAVWGYSPGIVLIPFAIAFVGGLVITGYSQSVAARLNVDDDQSSTDPVVPLLVILAAAVAMAIGNPLIGDACNATESFGGYG